MYISVSIQLPKAERNNRSPNHRRATNAFEPITTQGHTTHDCPYVTANIYGDSGTKQATEAQQTITSREARLQLPAAGLALMTRWCGALFFATYSPWDDGYQRIPNQPPAATPDFIIAKAEFAHWA